MRDVDEQGQARALRFQKLFSWAVVRVPVSSLYICFPVLLLHGTLHPKASVSGKALQTLIRRWPTRAWPTTARARLLRDCPMRVWTFELSMGRPE